MTTSVNNALSKIPRYGDHEIKRTSSLDSLQEGFFSQGEPFHEEEVLESSITADCLKVPMQFLSLETFYPPDEESRGLYALAQNIFQFSITDREQIYDRLHLNEEEKNYLEGLHEIDQASYEKKLEGCLECFAENSGIDDPGDTLSSVAELLEVHLVVVNKKEEMRIVRDCQDTFKLYEWDHDSLRDPLCKAVAEKMGLFTNNQDKTIDIISSSQSAYKVREVYTELARIRSDLLLIHAGSKSLEEMQDNPYILWYSKYIQDDVFDSYKAIEDVITAEKRIQDLAENMLKPAIRSRPLAIVMQEPSQEILIQPHNIDFFLDERSYVIKKTKGDGACALHAMLGEEINGEYRVSGPAGDVGRIVKTEYTDRLTARLQQEDSLIIDLFIETLSSFFTKTDPDISADMLFNQSVLGRQLKLDWDQMTFEVDVAIKKLRADEASLWLSCFEVRGSGLYSFLMQKVAALTTAGKTGHALYGKNEDEISIILKSNPMLILDMVDENSEAFFGLIEEQKGGDIQTMRLSQKRALSLLDIKRRGFILREEVVSHYSETVKDPYYYLNTQEIRIAAHLFNKKVQVVASIGDSVQVADTLMNENASSDLVVIYHQVNHFERCIPVKTSAMMSTLQGGLQKWVTNYSAVDLQKFEESSIKTYGIVASCKGLDQVLECIDHGSLDDKMFTLLYGGRSREQVFNEYDKILNKILRSMGSKDRWSVQDENIISKIKALKGDLQSQLPKGLRENRSFILDHRFNKLRDISIYLKNKCFIDDLAKSIGQSKKSEIKKILRTSGIFSDFDEVSELADTIKEARSKDKGAQSEQITKQVLFKQIYKQDYHEKFEEISKQIQDMGNRHPLLKNLHVDSPQIIEEIDKMILEHTEEKNREYQEKSLNELCSEYAKLNKIDQATIDKLKANILNIRLCIEDIKNGKILPSDKNQQYPIALIAEICIKIEKRFGDMLRDTQLIAILSMLDETIPKGGLSQLETGEGKTYVIVALAIIKNKQGHEVDVITSSATLAIRDVDSFKDFYKEDFGIFCSHNLDSDAGMQAKNCYQPRSIVYGTSASFEGDTLRSEFYQAPTFNGRRLGIAIVDEADSALLDKASWLCQISDSVAGMSTARALLYFIWALVLKKLEENKDRKIESKDDFSALLKEIRESAASNLEEFFSSDKSFVIPEHLKEFANYRIPYWIDSALRAVFYSQNREYYASKELNKITPIDYANTGEWEKDVQWEDGLHQFLQMKNGMCVETETLTKAFMSNFTLINKYSCIYGLSGTLGESEEAETFDTLYGVKVRKIPKFKTCRYEEKTAWLSSGKEQWLDSLYTDVVNDGLKEESSSADKLPSAETERRRATLIICKTIADVKEVEEHFKKKGIKSADIVTYTQGDEDKSKIKAATKGKIIIATNLSGRGTDIDASSIEQAGGLHVIFSFLPSNRRIQDQGFGRTARKGLSGTARLIIKMDDIKEHHLQKEERPLLEHVNSTLKSNFKGTKLTYDEALWEIEEDVLNQGVRELKIKKMGSPQDKKSVLLSFVERLANGGKQQPYNTIAIDGAAIDDLQKIKFCSFALNYDSIMQGRNLMEKLRLESLRTEEKSFLLAKQALFESFQTKVHGIPQQLESDTIVHDPRLRSISLQLQELYKSYLLDEWAIFLDKVSKDTKLVSDSYSGIDSFKHAMNIQQMIESNDLYKMQYINASIDVNNEDVLSAADTYYEKRSEKVDMTGGFALYNRVFVTLRKNKENVGLARSYLEKAKEIFEKGEEYEKGILKVQRSVTCSDGTEMSQEDMEGTPMLRVIMTMKALVNRNIEELDKLAKDYSKLKVSFTNPYELKEKKADPNEKKDDGEKAYTIPDDLMQEAIKLGLKGPLKLEGEGTFWQAILCAIICVLVAIASIVAIALSGGAAAPLVALLGGKLAFGVIAGAVAGAAISGALNAIKGAINGDFSMNKFGKDVLTGLVTGAVGGGLGAGMAGLANGALQTASLLGRVAINAGIGVAAGAVAGGAGNLVGSGLHGNKITWEAFGNAMLHGAVGGAIGGAFAGIGPHGGNNLGREILAGGLGAAVGNAAMQGIRIAQGDSDGFDGLELLEHGLQGGAHAGIVAGAKKYFGARLQNRNQSIVPHQAKRADLNADFADVPGHLRDKIAGLPPRIAKAAKTAFHPNTGIHEARRAFDKVNQALAMQNKPKIDAEGYLANRPNLGNIQRNDNVEKIGKEIRGNALQQAKMQQDFAEKAQRQQMGANKLHQQDFGVMKGDRRLYKVDNIDGNRSKVHALAAKKVAPQPHPQENDPLVDFKKFKDNFAPGMRKVLEKYLQENNFSDLDAAMFIRKASKDQLDFIMKELLQRYSPYPKDSCHVAAGKVEKRGFDPDDIGGISVGGRRAGDHDAQVYGLHKMKSPHVEGDVLPMNKPDQRMAMGGGDVEFDVAQGLHQKQDLYPFPAARKPGGYRGDLDEHGIVYVDPNRNPAERPHADPLPEISMLKNQKPDCKGGHGDIHGDLGGEGPLAPKRNVREPSEPKIYDEKPGYGPKTPSKPINVVAEEPPVKAPYKPEGVPKNGPEVVDPKNKNTANQHAQDMPVKGEKLPLSDSDGKIVPKSDLDEHDPYLDMRAIKPARQAKNLTVGPEDNIHQGSPDVNKAIDFDGKLRKVVKDALKAQPKIPERDLDLNIEVEDILELIPDLKEEPGVLNLPKEGMLQHVLEYFDGLIEEVTNITATAFLRNRGLSDSNIDVVQNGKNILISKIKKIHERVHLWFSRKQGKQFNYDQLKAMNLSTYNGNKNFQKSKFGHAVPLELLCIACDGTYGYEFIDPNDASRTIIYALVMHGNDYYRLEVVYSDKKVLFHYFLKKITDQNGIQKAIVNSMPPAMAPGLPATSLEPEGTITIVEPQTPTNSSLPASQPPSAPPAANGAGRVFKILPLNGIQIDKY